MFSILASDRRLRRIQSLRHNTILGYSIAVACVGLAVLARLALSEGLPSGPPFIAFYPALIIATFLGGFGPGAVVLALSSLAAWYMFLPPFFSFELAPQGAVDLIIFVFVGGTQVILITFINAALDHVLTQERNFQTLVESAPSGILLIDGKGEITLANDAIERMFGYNRNDLIGQNYEILPPHRLHAMHGTLREAYLQNPETRRMGVGRDLNAQRKDGTEFPVQISLAPISSDQGQSVVATIVDITDRKQAEDRQRLLTRELHHRAGNLFQVIQSIANSTSGWSDKYEKERFIGRLQALARTNAVLIENAWQSAPLARVVEDELVAFSERLELCGCDIALGPTVAQDFALIVHELASNSAKYGALSAPGGQVFVEGKIERIKSEDVFFFKWSELGGPQVMNPMRKGFGTSILEGVARQFANSVELNYTVSG